MASAKRKRSYTCSQVLDMLANDSDSEGIDYEYDSDIHVSDDGSESDLSEHTLSEPSTRSQTPIVGVDSGKFYISLLFILSYFKTIHVKNMFE
jgi:hypothetical protein